MRSFAIAIFITSFLNLNFAYAKDEVLSSFELASPDSLTLQTLNLFFDLEGKRGNTYELIVPESQKSLLLFFAPMAKLIDADTAATAQTRLHSFRAKVNGDTYHSFNDIQNWMQNLTNQHPDFAQIVTYGKSAEGHPLTALHFKTDSNSVKPVLMITAATHGDELITTEVLIRMIDDLANGYKADARVTKMLDAHDLYFVPVLNPDGFIATRRYDGAVDPNRSYPYPGHETAKPSPSIAGIIHLFEMIHPAGSIDFHAYGELIMYPWAFTHNQVAEPFHSKYDALTASMASTNHYTYGPISDVIYVAPGSSADYYFWKSNSISLGIEMGQDKIPDPAEIANYVKSQEESTWKFIESF